MCLLHVAGHGRRLYLGEMTGRLVAAKSLMEMITEDLVTKIVVASTKPWLLRLLLRDCVVRLSSRPLGWTEHAHEYGYTTSSKLTHRKA